jgi:hypothetical protein
MPSFSSLHRDYQGDPPTPDSPAFLIHRGETIVALTLKEEFNRRFPIHGEMWFGDYDRIAIWGSRLASLRNTGVTLPVYLYPIGGTEYVQAGMHRVINDTTDAEELNATKVQYKTVPLSRIVYLERVDPPA